MSAVPSRMPGGHRAVPVLLEEVLAIDAFGTADDRQRPVRQPGQRPVRNRLPVFHQIALGDPRPQRPVGMRQRHPLDRLGPRPRCFRRHDRAAGPGGGGADRPALRRHGDDRTSSAWPNRQSPSDRSPAARIRIGDIPHHISGCLVLTQTQEHRVPHPAGAGPRGERDLRDQFRPHPVDAALQIVAGDHQAARRRAAQTVQPIPQRFQRLVGKPAADGAGVVQVRRPAS